MTVKLGSLISEYTVRNKADEDIPVYSVTNEQGFCTGYFSKEVASQDRTTYKIVPRGCFAYNPSRINVGSVDVQECEDRVIVSPLYVVFSVDEKLNRRYLLHYLKSDITLTYIKAYASGSVRDNLKFSILKDFPINLPSTEEQKQIVATLDGIDHLIGLRKEELSSLDELVKSRFIELFGDPLINEKGWTVSKLGEYMTLLTDFSSNGSYELLDSNVVMYDEPNYAIMVRTTDLESGNLSDGVKYIDRNAYELLAKSKIYGGELIMNKIGSAGKIYVMPKIDRPASLGRNAFMFRFDERLNMTYLYSFLTSDYGTAEIQQYVRGAVTKTITKESTRSIRIIVPPIALQEQFAAFVEQADKSKLAVQKALDELEILKKSLMQQYFG